MKDSSRRSFVKTSAATGLTFTFAGLIRAHGQSGGGNTTWNPEGTFISTNSGETTTYDPNGTYVTTDPGVTTTWDPDATTTPETTMPEETTTIETTAVWHSSWVFQVVVDFTHEIAHPNPTNASSSGRIFGGIMRVFFRNCLNHYYVIPYEVESGGYIFSSSELKKGSDTSHPPGDYVVGRSSNGGTNIPLGHLISVVPRRTGMLVHDPRWSRGSSGCIIITSGFHDWKRDMGLPACNALSSCPPAGTYPNPVPIVVRYANGLVPNYIFDDGSPSPYPPNPPPVADPLPPQEQ